MKKYFNLLGVGVLLLGCSSNDNLIDSNAELKSFVTAYKAHMTKNISGDMSKEEACKINIDSINAGFDEVGSSFKAMNDWLNGYKDPRVALFGDPQNITSQTTILIMSAVEQKACSKFVEGDASVFLNTLWKIK